MILGYNFIQVGIALLFHIPMINSRVNIVAICSGHKYFWVVVSLYGLCSPQLPQVVNFPSYKVCQNHLMGWENFLTGIKLNFDLYQGNIIKNILPHRS